MMENPWAHALDLLQAEGWNYTLTKAESSRHPRVEIRRNGVAYAVQAPTLDEAVGSLFGFATALVARPSQAFH